MDKDTRVVIVGAGAAGLTSAVTLKERGYRNITLIEREPAVGGKCHNHLAENRLFELGANIVFSGTTVMELARRTDTRLIEWFPIQIIDLSSGHVRRFGSTETSFSFPRRARNYTRLIVELMVRHRRLRADGFHGCAHVAELATPVRRWLAERRLDVIDETVMPFMIGAGLGYPEDDVPVAYFFMMLSCIRQMGISDLLRQRCYRFNGGYQQLWQHVASQLLPDVEIRLGTEVERVERPTGGPIRVHSRTGVTTCDALVVTAPEQALKFLDASAAEQDALARFRTFDLYTVGCTVKGVLPLGLCFIGPHTKSRTSLGHAFAYVPMTGRRDDDTAEFVFYSRGDSFVDSDVILENVRNDIAMQGCTIEGEPVVRRWPRYFPHVSAQDFASGFFRRLDGLQGERATYYLGEGISGTSVTVVVDHARAQIRRFFPDRSEFGEEKSHAASR